MTKKAMKYSLLTIAAVLLVAMAFAGAASATLTGDGTVESPYEIGTETELYEMASMVNAGGANATANYTLTASIMVTNTSYVPIGISADKSFNGTFDGRNHSISGAISNSSNTQGFGIFGLITNATIKNVVLNDMTVSANSMVGALVGNMDTDGSDTTTSSELDVSTYHSHISNVKLNNVSVSNSNWGSLGGLVGRAKNASLWIEKVGVDADCIVSSVYDDVGGLVGGTHSASVVIVDSTCNAKSITSSGKYDWGCGYSVGGLIGYASSGNYILQGCKVSGVSVTGLCGIGGLVGYASSSSLKIQDCEVEDCEVVRTEGTGWSFGVGGLVGGANNANLVGCNVAGTALKGSSKVGGLVGYTDSTKYLNISGCTVADCTVEFTTGQNQYGGAGLVGYIKNATSGTPVVSYLNNVMENVTIKPKNYTTTDLSQFPTGLVDAGVDARIKVVLSSLTDSIAPLKEIVIGDNVTIRNSSVCPYDSTTVKTEINQTDYQHVLDKITSVSVGDKVTSLDANAFNGASNLMSITDIDALTSIGANAFKGSKLTGGFYIPNTVTIDTYAFNGTDYLQIIYRNTTAGLAGLNESTAIVNITDAGTLATIQPGSFSVSSGNKFETVTLGSNTANKFKNLSDGTYLTANGPWTPGYSYLAEYEYIPPQYTPSSSKQTGSTIILQEGQTAPTAYATAAPTVSPTVKPTEQPATPTVIATAKPTTQATQASPAPFVGLLAGLGVAAVLLRLRK